MTATLIFVGGDATRWRKSIADRTDLPADKTRIVIDGEPLVTRTARLFSPARIVTHRNPGWVTALDKHLWTRQQGWWSTTGPTTVLFGDVYYSDDAAAHITEATEVPWRFFLRQWASQITAKPWGEMFGWQFAPTAHGVFVEALTALISSAPRREATGGWDLLSDLGYARSHIVEIDDWTEDFDYAVDFDRWQSRRDGTDGG